MKQSEAKMIAEELFKLMRKELRNAAALMVEEETETYLNIKEASEFTRLSVTTLRRNIDDIPHRQVGRKYMFSKRGLIRYIEGRA